MKTLYFVNGVPTPAQFAEVDRMEGNVEFRDINLFDPDAPIEKADAVAGIAPENYLEAYKVVPTEKAKDAADVSGFTSDVVGSKVKAK